jgi:hypothetical protein
LLITLIKVFRNTGCYSGGPAGDRGGYLVGSRVGGLAGGRGGGPAGGSGPAPAPSMGKDKQVQVVFDDFEVSFDEDTPL